MRIEFINHACYIVDTGKVRILCDPWLHGEAFDRGWKHLMPTPVHINDLDYDYIWISHEHPDHFSIQDIKEIEGTKIFFYQATKDGKVKKFLEEEGHKVIEMRNWKPYILPDESKMVVTRYGDDSWMYITNHEDSILNINDCAITNTKKLTEIKSKLGSPTVLMTQFSFAMWIGNEGDDKANDLSARAILERIGRQREILEPKFVIPFASYVKFVHEDNVWMNYKANKPWDTIPFIKPATPIIMDMMDKWTIGKKWNNKGKWNGPFVIGRALYKDTAQNMEDILDSFGVYQQKIKDKNSWLAIRLLKMIGFLPPTTVYLKDNRVAIQFDIVKGIKMVNLKPEECDIRMKGETFINVLRYEWGRGTLTVNSRFSANYKTMWKFFRQTKIAYANNVGKTVPLSLSLRELLYSYKPKWEKQ